MHHYTESGLDNIWLSNGYQIDDSISVDQPNNLHYTIASHMISLRSKLSPKEFKYLRNDIQATQATFAAVLGISESTIRNWEHGRSEISPIADRMIRMIYRSCAGDDPDVVNLVNDLTVQSGNSSKLIFKYTSRWELDKNAIK